MCLNHCSVDVPVSRAALSLPKWSLPPVSCLVVVLASSTYLQGNATGVSVRDGSELAYCLTVLNMHVVNDVSGVAFAGIL